VCAVVASSTVVSDPVGARKLGHASIGLSVAGIIVTVVVIIIVVAVVTTRTAQAISEATSCSYYYYNGVCYTYRSNYNGFYCSGEVSTYDNYCYHF